MLYRRRNMYIDASIFRGYKYALREQTEDTIQKEYDYVKAELKDLFEREKDTVHATLLRYQLNIGEFQSDIYTFECLADALSFFLFEYYIEDFPISLFDVWMKRGYTICGIRDEQTILGIPETNCVDITESLEDFFVSDSISLRCLEEPKLMYYGASTTRIGIEIDSDNPATESESEFDPADLQEIMKEFFNHSESESESDSESSDVDACVVYTLTAEESDLDSESE